MKEEGATAIEYGLIAGLVVLALLIGLRAYGTTVSDMYTYLSDTVKENTD